MKRIIAFAIILTLAFSCLISINIVASDDFGKAEAEALLIEAYQRYMLTQNLETSSEDKYLKDDYIGKQDTTPKIPMADSGEWEYETSSKGTPYKTAQYFVPATDSRFDTMAKCYAYMEEVFTEDWAKLIVDVHRTSTSNQIRETFRTSEGGILYYYEPGEREASVPFEQDPNWKNVKVVHHYVVSTGDMWRQLKSIGDFKLNGNTASLDVVITIMNPDKYEWNDYNKGVTFEKTAAGWRVSGGSFFEEMHLYNFNGAPPQARTDTR